MDGVFYKCQVLDCKVKEVYTEARLLTMHYGRLHKGIPVPKTEQSKVYSVPEGYQIRKPEEKEDAHPKVSTEGSTEAPPEASTGTPAGAPGGKAAEASGAKKNLYKVTTDTNEVLEQILKGYPGLDEGVVKEIMDYASLQGSLHPMEVRQLLSMMAGVPKGAADIIPQKYTLALNKAAREGNNDVGIIMSSWGFNMGNQTRANMGLFPFYNTPPGGQYFTYGYRPGTGWPGWNGPSEATRTEHVETAADVERTKRLENLERNQTEISKSLEAILKQITQTEEQKREAALNARLDKLESSIMELANAPRSDEGKDSPYNALMEELKATRAEIAKVKEETAQTRISSLESSVKALTEEIKSQEQQKIEALTKEVEAAKTAKAPVVGKTEMDVVSELATKALDTAKDAGKDIKAFLMSGSTKKEFNPARGDAAARKEAGEKIAEAVETESDLITAEDNYLAKK